MKLYVGITDYDWFKLHASKQSVEEVNFWKPSSQLGFKVLQWGEPFLFKLHAPRNFIVGGGFYTKFLRLTFSRKYPNTKSEPGAVATGAVARQSWRARLTPDSTIKGGRAETLFFIVPASVCQSPP